MLATLYCILSIWTIIMLFLHLIAVQGYFYYVDRSNTICYLRDTTHRLILQVEGKPAYKSILTNHVNQEILRRSFNRYRFF